jgi:hypothetical protein
MPTSVSLDGITAGIPANEISKIGEKKVEIQSILTKEIIPVGVFKVVR